MCRVYMRGVAVMPLNIGKSAEPCPTPTQGQMKDGDESFLNWKNEKCGRK